MALAKFLERFRWIPNFAVQKAGQEFLGQLVALVGAKNNQQEVAQVFTAFIAVKAQDNALAFSLVRSLGDGLQKSGGSLAKSDTQGMLKGDFCTGCQGGGGWQGG